MTILYSTHCPKCKMLETKLIQAGVDFTVVDDIEQMKALKYNSAPHLVVDGTSYDFNEAIKWLKTRG